MQKIVVTGGSGKAGRAVVADLQTHGFTVTNLDIAADRNPDAPTRQVDLTDLGQTYDALKGADGVVHLAAIPAPNITTDGETFHINTLSTYNVFAAATALGVDRIVWASSETLIGIPLEREQPRYVPIDEAHPRLPESHYALSKLVGEVMAEQFSRWSGATIVGLRISNIMEPEDYSRFPGFWEDPTLRKWNLWGYVDARDVAQAARLALTAELSGAPTYLVAAADTCMTTSNEDLLAAVFPDVEVRTPVGDHATLLSIELARRQLGYEPEHSWRDYVDDTA